MRFLFRWIFFAVLGVGLACVNAQRPGRPGGPPPMRKHEANQSQTVTPIPADAKPPAKSEVKIELEDGKRHIQSNGIPAHKIGSYPARHNPNAIGVQQYDVKIDANPEPAKRITRAEGLAQPGPPNMPIGFAINGVFFEPGTAEFWRGDRELGWNYEALGGAVPLGIDANFGHVQPNGAYHYHGMPTGLLKKLGVVKGKHSPLVGWAADGFPIYARFGYKDPKDAKSKVVEFRSSFRLKKGERPGGNDGPGGAYDGAFTRDYEYVEGLGDLDECNGRFAVTPEFPEGTYAYFLTENWPVIPRAFRGEPINIKMPARGGPRRR